VRSPQWQQDFLAKPLAERQQIARGIRSQSENRKRSGATYADVDASAAVAWLHAAKATVLVHGHTHRPAQHDLGHGLQRWVMTDWDASSDPQRGELLHLSAAGLQRVPLDW
jgi:UDP-2,3-diacylglucosamine hydrolase